MEVCATPFVPHCAESSRAATVAHGNQIPYTFGVTFLAGSPQPAANLSETMLDYWISFVVSLDPNDGKGSTRQSPRDQIFFAARLMRTFPLPLGPQWKKYRPANPVSTPCLTRVLLMYRVFQTVMQLQGDNVSVIPDTFRATPISFINTHPIPFNH